MPIPFSDPRVTIRPALPSDTPDVLEFCKHIWGGTDYLPSIWDEWLHDPQGFLFTAEYAGRAVGVTRVSRVTFGQWWFEGFRVDPAYQGLGIGTRIHEYIVAWWLAHGEGAVRLWTNSKRVKIHHLCEKTGFTRALERAVYAAPALGERTEAFIPVRPEEVPAALELALRAGSLPVAGGKLEVFWQTATPNAASLEALVRQENNRLFWWRGREGLLGLWENDERPEDVHPMIAVAACETAGLPALLLDARRASRVWQPDGFQKIAWNAPVTPALEPILASAGFAREDDDSNYEYERFHPTRP
jgi:GNAT superfamily N-acetyltransferase